MKEPVSATLVGSTKSRLMAADTLCRKQPPKLALTQMKAHFFKQRSTSQRDILFKSRGKIDLKQPQT